MEFLYEQGQKEVGGKCIRHLVLMEFLQKYHWVGHNSLSGNVILVCSQTESMNMYLDKTCNMIQSRPIHEVVVLGGLV